MNEFPIEAFHLLIFTIPGFFVVWSYRKFGTSDHISDFEYLMFSLFWGLIMVTAFAQITKKDALLPLLSNPYAGALLFSFLGTALGYYATKMSAMLQEIYSFLKRND